MRILGGKFRGLSIKVPSGLSTRPTSARAREAIFNILQHGKPNKDLCGSNVLDVFAGSGALGLEALSRGARKAIFIDNDHVAKRALRENAVKLGLLAKISILDANAPDFFGVSKDYEKAFDLVFMDAPYREKITLPTLEGLKNFGWLARDAALVVEISAKDTFIRPSGFEIVADRVIGKARFLFMQFL